MPPLSLRSTVRQVAPHRDVTEEETEARRGQGTGPSRQEPGFESGEVLSSRPEHPPRPGCCPRRAGCWRRTAAGPSSITCTVRAPGGCPRPVGAGEASEPCEAVPFLPGARAGRRPRRLRRPRAQVGEEEPRRVHAPAHSQPAGHPEPAPSAGAAPAGLGWARSWEGLGEPCPGLAWHSRLGPGSEGAKRPWAVPARTSCPALRAGLGRRHLPQEGVQALFARAPPQDRRAAHAAGGRRLAGDLA